MKKNNQVELLKEELDNSKYDVYVETYPMSLGELVSLYKDKDIDLKAAYQRVFKWTNEQKTKFIESLFLGLPIPSVFLYQDENALWEVVDGIQRLSTIFEFVGELKTEQCDNEGNIIKKEPLLLSGAPKLSALNGLRYVDLSEDLKREFKKFKLQLIIISKKSSNDVKLEVFRRLNGFGTKLNAQELRNALILLLNKDYFDFVERLSVQDDFNMCLSLNKELLNDKKHYEYIIRYLILREEKLLEEYSVKNNPSIDDLFDEAIADIINKNKLNLYEEEKKFKMLFSLLNDILGKNSFKKYYYEQGKRKGPVRESIFEAIVPGIVNNIAYYLKHKDELIDKINSLFLEDSEFEKVLAPNPKAIERMKKLLVISKAHFKVND